MHQTNFSNLVRRFSRWCFPLVVLSVNRLKCFFSSLFWFSFLSLQSAYYAVTKTSVGEKCVPKIILVFFSLRFGFVLLLTFLTDIFPLISWTFGALPLKYLNFLFSLFLAPAKTTLPFFFNKILQIHKRAWKCIPSIFFSSLLVDVTRVFFSSPRNFCAHTLRKKLLM